MIAKADPNYPNFTIQFNQMSLPYTFDYNTAKGREITSDPFITRYFIPRSGTSIYALGKICECNDNASYLIMLRNQGQSTDVSTFQVASFTSKGTYLGAKLIGSTQKDPSGTTLFTFTISGGCGFNITGQTLHPNGHKESLNVNSIGCRIE